MLAIVLGWPLAGLAADNQTGAESVKTPVKAAIVDVRKIPDWQGEAVGNVEVTYADGSRDRWTTLATAQQPRVAADGVVGWVDCSKEEAGKKQMDIYKGVPVGSRLVLCASGKVTARINAGKPFIEQWGFAPDGQHVIVKSRAAHGPALIERFSRADGKPNGSVAGFDGDAPDWAKAYLDK